MLVVGFGIEESKGGSLSQSSLLLEGIKSKESSGLMNRCALSRLSFVKTVVKQWFGYFSISPACACFRRW